MRLRLVVDGESRDIELAQDTQGYTVRIEGSEYRVRATASKGAISIRIGSETYRIRFEASDVLVDDRRHAITIAEVIGDRPGETSSAAGRADAVEVRSPMPGRIVRVLVAPGAWVKRGQTLLILEAMKMQNEIPAPRDGVVGRVDAVEGETITADRVVAVLDVR